MAVYSRRVTPAPKGQQSLNVNADPNAFGAAMGGALQGAGVAVLKVADVISAKGQLDDENAARKAQLELVEFTRQLRFDPETGYLNQTGENALGRRADFEGRLDAERSRIGAGLSPRARKAYERMTDDLVVNTRSSFIQHDADQTRATTVATYEATTQAHVDEAMLNYNNPEVFNGELDKALAEQARSAALQGTPPEVLQEAQGKLVSSVYAGAITRMADEGSGGPTRAEAFLNENIEKLNSEDAAKLRSILKPMVVQDKALTWVDEHDAMNGSASARYEELGGSGYGQRSADATALLTDSYANQTRTRESGSAQGNAGAKSSSSSAAGPYQFTASTFVAMVKRAQGKGGAKWADGLTDDQIADMRWTGTGNDEAAVRAANDEAFVEFRLMNQAQLQKYGLPVTPENEYLMHFAGIGGGIAILQASDGAMLETVMGIDAAKANGMVGKTVGWLKRNVASSFGAPSAPAGSPTDYAGLYRGAMSIDDPDVRAAAMNEINFRKEASDMADAIDRQNTFDSAYQRGLKTGDWSLSTQEMLSMGSSLTSSFYETGRMARSGQQYTDPVLYADLQDMAVDPEKVADFLKTDLGDFMGAGKLSSEAYLVLRDMQRTIGAEGVKGATALAVARGNQDSAKAMKDNAQIIGATLGFDITGNVKDLDDEQRKMYTSMQQQLMSMMQEFVVKNQAEPGAADISGMVYEMLTPVNVDGESVPLFFANEKRRPGQAAVMETVPYDEIPADIVEALGTYLAGENPGLEGPELLAEVEKAYALTQSFDFLDRGVLPDISVSDIPSSFLTEAGIKVTTKPGRTFYGTATAGESEYVVTVDGTDVALDEADIIRLYAKRVAREAGLQDN